MSYTKTPTSDLLRMYEGEGLSVPEIAVRCGRTRQAIYLRLRRAGVKLELRTSWKPLIAKDVLEQLYIDQRLSGREIAERLELSLDVVYRNLKRFRIDRRRDRGRRPWKYPELTTLKIGASITVPRPKSRGKFQGIFYVAAKRVGFKVSVRLEGESVRLIRVA